MKEDKKGERQITTSGSTAYQHLCVRERICDTAYAHFLRSEKPPTALSLSERTPEGKYIANVGVD